MLTALVVGLICGVAGTSEATTRTVATDGSGHFTSIQQAILASAHGDTVLVFPGRYFDRLFYGGRRIVVRSAGGPARTIIDAQSTGTVATFLIAEPAAAVLEGFTLTGGSGTFLTRQPQPRYSEIPEIADGGIVALGFDRRTGVFESAPADDPDSPDSVAALGGLKYGGAILCLPGHPTLRNLRIVGNSANVGGGIYGEGSAPRLESCVFGNNFAGTGAGGAFRTSGPFITDCSFSDAICAAGGGLDLTDCSAQIQDCVFHDNQAGEGGGIRSFSETGGSAVFLNTVKRSIFIRNIAGYGSAIYNEHGSIDVRQCLFFRNGYTEADVDLATVYMTGGRAVTFAQNAFFENAAATAFLCEDPPVTPVTITCNDFYPAPIPETDCLDGPDNFTRQPLFCNWRDPERDGFALRPDSPLLASNSPHGCGQVGPFAAAGCPHPFADILNLLQSQGPLPPLGTGRSKIE